MELGKVDHALMSHAYRGGGVLTKLDQKRKAIDEK
jgi:hypothetical protein